MEFQLGFKFLTVIYKRVMEVIKSMACFDFKSTVPKAKTYWVYHKIVSGRLNGRKEYLLLETHDSFS